jgi:arsenate reductase
MAEGFLKSFDSNLDVFSAGTKPEKEVNPKAIKVMEEKGIDIDNNKTEHVEKYINDSFDYVITVCDSAKETCPVFMGDVKHRLHIGFEDPAEATGSEKEQLKVYRKIRDQIEQEFYKLYRTFGIRS